MMDPAVQREIDAHATDGVVFPYTTNHRHHTWARTFSSRPELYTQPQTTEEIRNAVTLARRCRRRITVVGSGHSPSDLTCTTAWMMNLDRYNQVLNVDREKKVVVVRSGIRLFQLGEKLADYGFMLPNLGSIDHQSIAGALATATHGSTLRHGILSESVLALQIMLSSGEVKRCSPTKNVDLFRAALVSLGALGIITEVTLQVVDSFKIEWEQSIVPLTQILDTWSSTLWTQAEYVRVWWMPYGKRVIVWKADKTQKPLRKFHSWYGSLVGYYTYHNLLYLAQWIPRLLPTIEWFVFGMQYGFRDGVSGSAVEEGRSGLLMDCLYSQCVNEWAIPLSKGPEAINRLQAWLDHDQARSGIPYSPKGVWVHSPVEVRVSDTSTNKTLRPHLDPSCPTEATLYLNATLYRPYLCDPPCKERYYQAFEWLMRDLGGRPHWAKNFGAKEGIDREAILEMYGNDMNEWVRLQKQVDPKGMFVGDWQRRWIFGRNDDDSDTEKSESPDDENSVYQTWGSVVQVKQVRKLQSETSEDSFDVMHEGDAAESMVILGGEEGGNGKYAF